MTGLPSFDLVVATLGRADEPARLLASLERQSHQSFRILLVDQNEDDRLLPLVAEQRSLDVRRLRSPPGLSRARNLALGHLSADLVAFPDDDCQYPDELLEQVARHFADRPELEGLTGRAADASGRSSASWKLDAALLEPCNLWNRAISYTIFLRRRLIEQIGGFDEQLGLGAGTPWSSGEEIDYLVRAVRDGARIEYDPDLVVFHPQREHSASERRALGFRDGASVGYILRRQGYGPQAIGRMLARPAGGIAWALLRRDPDVAAFHAATLHGRVVGLTRAAK